jgi:hypothetical protein
MTTIAPPPEADAWPFRCARVTRVGGRPDDAARPGGRLLGVGPLAIQL